MSGMEKGDRRLRVESRRSLAHPACVLETRTESTFAGPFGGIRYEHRRSHRASYTERRSADIHPEFEGSVIFAQNLHSSLNGLNPIGVRLWDAGRAPQT